MTRSGRVLIYSTGALGERLTGPEIRALEFARALGQEHDVTLIAERPEIDQRDGIRVVPASRQRLLTEAARHDAFLSPCLPPYLLAGKEVLRVAAIADAYDPHEVELAALDGERPDTELRLRALAQALDLRAADLILCAADSQRQRLISTARQLTPVGRDVVDPVVVPFGIPDPPPPSGRTPLRDHFSQIAEGDQVILWWGAVWAWLDVETPIRAMARLAQTRPGVKLVITAGRPPVPGRERFEAVDQARALAGELGVLGCNVLFLDEWIPYEERHDYLRDADLGITLHRFSAEAQLAARARYMDYLSAGLPCVLGRGDEAAADFEAAGFATLVDDPDPERLAGLLTRLLDDPSRLRAAADAGHRLADARRWSSVGSILRDAVGNVLADRDRRRGSARTLTLTADAGSYYARKLAHRLGTAVASR